MVTVVGFAAFWFDTRINGMKHTSCPKNTDV